MRVAKRITPGSWVRRCAVPLVALVAGVCGGLPVVMAARARTGSGADAAAQAERQTEEPGLVLTVTSAGRSDSRLSRMAALYVPQGMPASSMSAPGAFSARFQGAIRLRIRDEGAFSVAGRGSAKLWINGKLVLQGAGEDLSKLPASATIRLNKGRNELVLEYSSPSDGDAAVRVYWQGPDFPSEPVPPTVLVHAPLERAARRSLEIRRGRELVADLHCLRCHAPDAALQGQIARQQQAMGRLTIPAAMPELAADAPSLDGAGSRFNQPWLEQWISDPRALRPTATMPRLFHSGDGGTIDPRIRDIAAYLATLRSGADLPQPKVTAELAAGGGKLFANLHCAACHTLPDAAGPDTARNRVPLNRVKAKFAPAALLAFLKTPEAHYQWIRMPNFALTDREAQRLAAFLLSRAPAPPAAAPAGGDSTRGKQLFASVGCANCHAVDLTPANSTLNVPALAQLTGDALLRGCLADKPSETAPAFALAPENRLAIREFLASSRDSLGRDNLGEFVERQIRQLNCTNCHPRDGRAEAYVQIAPEVASMAGDDADDEMQGFGDERYATDQTLPMLTWTGEKLRPQWIAHTLSGTLDIRLRPWLKARMPAFRSRAWSMALGWPLEHGFSQTPAPPPAQDPKLAAIGRRLAGKEGGFACVSCHRVGSQPPIGLFDAPGINFAYIVERLRRPYFERWVYSPIRLNPDSKMPTFADPDGETSIRDVLGGDARRQYDAIYQYMLFGRKIEPPEN